MQVSVTYTSLSVRMLLYHTRAEHRVLYLQMHFVYEDQNGLCSVLGMYEMKLHYSTKQHYA